MGNEYLQGYTQPTRSGVPMCDNEDSEDNKSEMNAVALDKLNHLVKSFEKMMRTRQRGLEQWHERVDDHPKPPDMAYRNGGPMPTRHEPARDYHSSYEPMWEEAGYYPLTFPLCPWILATATGCRTNTEL